jgi:hypothetical protein
MFAPGSPFFGDHLSFTVVSVVVLYVYILCVFGCIVMYCFRIFIEEGTPSVGYRPPDLKLSQAFDSVVGDASSADATGLQDPAAAEVDLVGFKAFERPSFRWMENVLWCNFIIFYIYRCIINFGQQYFWIKTVERCLAEL